MLCAAIHHRYCHDSTYRTLDLIKLSRQQELFAQGIAKGKTQSDAYREAYPASLKWEDKSLWSKASTLAADEKVKRRVAELQAPAIKKLDISIERIMLERARMAFFDPRKLFDDDGKPIHVSKLDDDTAAAIAGLDIVMQGNESMGFAEVAKIKLADKNASLTALEKINGMYKDDDTKANPLSIHIHLA